jgi:hypothetical protein
VINNDVSDATSAMNHMYNSYSETLFYFMGTMEWTKIIILLLALRTD